MKTATRSVILLLVGLVLGASSQAPSPGRSVAPQVANALEEARSLGIYRSPQSPRLGPWLTGQVEENPGREIKVWVFFTDKGLGNETAFRGALSRVENSWNEATRSRRAALGPAGRAVFSDLPVYEPYVDALRAAGFEPLRVSRWLNAVSVRVPAFRLQELETHGYVRFLQPVLVSSRMPEPGDDLELRGPQRVGTPDSTMEATFYGDSYFQLDQIQVLDLHREGYTGAGVKVMVLDTGFKSSHPAFTLCTNLADQYDYVQDDGNTENEAGDSSSQHNHGTGVWGTLGGFAPGDLIGPAWAAEFYLAKTEDLLSETPAEEDNYVAALEWADTLGVDVTSASLAYLTFDGGSGYSYADLDGDTAVISVAVDLAVSKGITCVNAMGNSGPSPGTLWTPADADSVIACGSVTSSGTVSSFSSRGPTADARIKPEITARGSGTRWAVASSDGYGFANGTSLSTPLIGGLAALIKEARPSWTGAQIRDALMQTGTNMATPNNDIGWGVAQGWDAVNFGGGPLSPPRMTLPFALCDPAHESTVLSTTPELVWGTSAAKQPGDAAQYTVHYQIGSLGSELTASAGADTSWTVPGATLAPGDTLVWWVSAVGDSGYVRKSMDTRTLFVDSQVAVGEDVLPPVGILGAPAPNPFRGATRIAWRGEPGERVNVSVFDLQGREIWGTTEMGSGAWSSLTWSGTNKQGVRVPPGMYWIRAQSSAGAQTRKLIKLP